MGILYEVIVGEGRAKCRSILSGVRERRKAVAVQGSTSGGRVR
jgi:hypothetical protein